MWIGKHILIQKTEIHNSCKDWWEQGVSYFYHKILCRKAASTFFEHQCCLYIPFSSPGWYFYFWRGEDETSKKYILAPELISMKSPYNSRTIN